MTVRQIAESLDVSNDTIKNCIRRIFPDKMQHGKLTLLNESEVAMISKELKNNTAVNTHLTHEVSSRVANTTTRLEILTNYKAATEAMIQMLEAEKEELRLRAEKAESVVNRIADSTGMKTIKETADILGYGEKTYFALLRDMGILFRENGTNLPKREYINSGYFEVKEEPYERNGKICLYSRVYVTAKGLLWLEKKTPRVA